MTLLIETNAKLLNLCLLLLRCTVGLILFGVGSGKVFGWFGGFGLEQTLQFYVMDMGIPTPFAYLSIYTELIGGFLLAAGLFTRLAALAIMANMLVATIFTLPMGVLTVAAYPFSLAISALVILLAGPMAYSIDSMLRRRRGEVSYGV